MRVELFVEDPNNKLRDFFESFTLEDLMHFRIRRPTGFFQPYKIASDNHWTFCLMNSQEKILALATFISHHLPNYRLIQALDLRVSSSRQATLGWHQNFIPTVELLQSKYSFDGLFSLLSQNDKIVLNTFLRAHPFKRKSPKYHFFKTYYLTTIHGFYPFPSRKLSGYKVADFKTHPLNLLKSCSWEKYQLKKDLAKLRPVPQANWIGCFQENTQEVLGFFQILPGSATQEYIPLKYSRKAHNFRQYLKFISKMGWAHPLTKPFSRTGQEQPLNFFHLVNIWVSHADIFDYMIRELWRKIPKNSFLIYLRSEDQIQLRPSRGSISVQLPYDAFFISLPGKSLCIPLDEIQLPLQSLHVV